MSSNYVYYMHIPVELTKSLSRPTITMGYGRQRQGVVVQCRYEHTCVSFYQRYAPPDIIILDAKPTQDTPIPRFLETRSYLSYKPIKQGSGGGGGPLLLVQTQRSRTPSGSRFNIGLWLAAGGR